MPNEKARIAIVGGGVAALEAALGLHWEESIEAEVTLISQFEDFIYRPLAVLEPFGYGKAPRFKVGEIVGDAVDRILIDTIAEFDIDGSKLVTSGGDTIEFDAAIVATGAEGGSSLENAIVIGTPGVMERLGILVAQVDAGVVERIAFVVPEGACWMLPLYELAMFTADRATHRLRKVEVRLFTPEAKPLLAFGKEASEHVHALLSDAGVELVCGAKEMTYRDGVLRTSAGIEFETKYVVAVPELHGSRTPGLPHDAKGFLPVDEFGLVKGTANIYAAGDTTDFPIKQGGIASQQADVVVGAVTEQFGERSNPHSFEPELRGLLLSHRGKTSMRAIIGNHDDALDAVSKQSLQALTEKIYSRHLTSRLATLMATHAAAD